MYIRNTKPEMLISAPRGCLKTRPTSTTKSTVAIAERWIADFHVGGLSRRCGRAFPLASLRSDSVGLRPVRPRTSTMPAALPRCLVLRLRFVLATSPRRLEPQGPAPACREDHRASARAGPRRLRVPAAPRGRLGHPVRRHGHVDLAAAAHRARQPPGGLRQGREGRRADRLRQERRRRALVAAVLPRARPDAARQRAAGLCLAVPLRAAPVGRGGTRRARRG